MSDYDKCECASIVGKCPRCIIREEEAKYTARRADELQQLRQQNAALAAALDWWNGLVGESKGVYGRHLNGDPSPWDEFELPCVENVDRILSAHDAEKDRKIAELAAALVRVVNLFSEISLKGHKTGYDWNADPESLTLIGSRIFEAQDEPEDILSTHDAAVRRPLLEALREVRARYPADYETQTDYEARMEVLLDEILSRYNPDGSERKWHQTN